MSEGESATTALLCCCERSKLALVVSSRLFPIISRVFSGHFSGFPPYIPVFLPSLFLSYSLPFSIAGFSLMHVTDYPGKEVRGSSGPNALRAPWDVQS